MPQSNMTQIRMALKDYAGNNGNDQNNANPPGNTTPGGLGPIMIPIGQTPTDDNNENPDGLGLIDYNAKFKNASPTLFRENIVAQMMAILSSPLKPNCILNGPAGTGKTKIVEDFARMLANDDPLVPPMLKNANIYELPIGTIVAGTSYRGEMEKKLYTIISFLENQENQAILFLDEIHILLSGSNSYNEIAQILKPALGRGSIKVIGATTNQEFEAIMKDPAFERRFSSVLVNELTPEQTVEILRSMQNTIATTYKVTVSDEILPIIVSISDQKKKAWHHRPDSAIKLLDHATGDTMIEHLQRMKEETNPMVKCALQQTIPTLTEAQVEKTAHRLLTGHATRPKSDKESLTQALSEIKGQEEAVKLVIEETMRGQLDLYPSKKPQVYMFAGPSGTGKTRVAEILANYLTNEDPIILNMTEFHDSESINRIIGAPAGYAGYDSHQELPFDILDTNPFQVILLDEFEKCHRGVQRLFMSAFEKGTIVTAKNKIIDFRKAIIITTTNASVTKAKPLGFGAKEEAPTTASLTKDFDTELLNRIGEKRTCFFQPISKETYREICQGQYRKLISIVQKSRPSITLPDQIPDKELDTLVENSYNPIFNARPAEETVKTWIENQVMLWLANHP